MPLQQPQHMLGLAAGHGFIGGVRVEVDPVGDAQPLALAGVALPVGVVLVVFAVAVPLAAVPAAQDGKLHTGVLHRLPVDLSLVVAHVDAPVGLAAAAGVEGGDHPVLRRKVSGVHRHAVLVAAAVLHPGLGQLAQGAVGGRLPDGQLILDGRLQVVQPLGVLPLGIGQGGFHLGLQGFHLLPGHPGQGGALLHQGLHLRWGFGQRTGAQRQGQSANQQRAAQKFLPPYLHSLPILLVFWHIFVLYSIVTEIRVHAKMVGNILQR